MTPEGEALEFRWFDVDALPGPDQLWPGVELALAELCRQDRAEDQLAVYEAVNASYISHRELMWQTPTLSITAMAFLLTIALGEGADWRRAAAGLLATVIAVVSVQLMDKHSTGEIRDADVLHAIEVRRGMLPHHAGPGRRVDTGLHGAARLVARLRALRSRRIWMSALVGLGVVSLTIAILALFGI